MVAASRSRRRGEAGRLGPTARRRRRQVERRRLGMAARGQVGRGRRLAGGHIPKRNSAPDLLPREYRVFVPADEDSDVAGAVWRHCKPRSSSWLQHGSRQACCCSVRSTRLAKPFRCCSSGQRSEVEDHWCLRHRRTRSVTEHRHVKIKSGAIRLMNILPFAQVLYETPSFYGVRKSIMVLYRPICSVPLN